MEAGDNNATAQGLRAGFVRRREQLVRRYISAAPQLWLLWPSKSSPQALLLGKAMILKTIRCERCGK